MMLARGSAPVRESEEAGQKPASPNAAPTIEVRHSLRNATSRPLSAFARPPQTPPPGTALRDIEMEEGPTAHHPRPPLRPDPVLQSHAAANMPSPLVNFEGTGNVNGVQPADTTMAVGPNHVLQWVNLAFQIFDKSGTSLAGPFDGNTLFTDLGGDCADDQRRRHHRHVRPIGGPLVPRAAGARDLRRHRQPRVHGGVDERRPARHVLPLRLPVQRVRAERLSALRHVARRVLHDRAGVRQRLPDDGHGLRPPGHAQRPAPHRDLRGADQFDLRRPAGRRPRRAQSSARGLLHAARDPDGRRHAGHRRLAGVGPPHVAHASRFRDA